MITTRPTAFSTFVCVGACLAAAILSGCATRVPSVADRLFVRRGGKDGNGAQEWPKDKPKDKKAESASPPATAAPPPVGSLEEFIEKVRHLSAAARPKPPEQFVTLERTDPELAALRLLLTSAPTAANHRKMAEAYVRHNVLDAAYDHFSAALAIAPHDVAALDGRARIWRDWGFPHLGLSDVYRAIYYAPAAAEPRNTLGTLLLKMGQMANAQAAFERAIALNPQASYALNNLCYASVLQGQAARAIGECKRALAIQSVFAAAHNNLGLAYAASGQWEAATAEFGLGGGRGAARFNLGVALMATRRYGDAARAFDEASALRPSLHVARERARQARTLEARAAQGAVDANR